MSFIQNYCIYDEPANDDYDIDFGIVKDELSEIFTHKDINERCNTGLQAVVIDAIPGGFDVSSDFKLFCQFAFAVPLLLMAISIRYDAR